MKKLTLLFFAVAALSAGGCRLYKLESRLGPENSDFLSKVRYIISGEERRLFLELPDPEKPRFIEEFWSRRDPDPETEENEYKMDYFDRIEESSRLFPSEGRPGWQTDRGRIYVLFGPPTQRLTYPLGDEDGCREVWYYMNFPVIFVDEHCSGHFVMTPINLEHLTEINKVQDYFQKPGRLEKKRLDFDVKAVCSPAGGEGAHGLITVDVPYSGIWFVSGGDGRLTTVLTVEIEIRDDDGEVLWDFKNDFPVSIDEAGAEETLKEKHHLEIPFAVSGETEMPGPGKTTLHIKVRNSTEGEELRKELGLRLKP